MEPTYTDRPAQPVEPVQPVQPVQPAQSVEPGGYGYGQPVRPVVERPGVPPSYRAAQFVYLVLGIIEGLIVIRLVLKLLAANAGAAFTSLIYGITGPLVAPFQGVFPTPQTDGSILEVASLLALIVYALIAWAIVRIIRISANRREPPVAA